jgi:hypothetical protein
MNITNRGMVDEMFERRYKITFNKDNLWQDKPKMIQDLMDEYNCKMEKANLLSIHHNSIYGTKQTATSVT